MRRKILPFNALPIRDIVRVSRRRIPMHEFRYTVD